MSRISSIVIPLSKAQPNGWNPNMMDATMYRKELASLRKFGYVNPILVRHKGKDYEIIDGEHRWRALHELGYEEAEVTVIEGISDEEARQLTIVLNETRGNPDPTRLGVLLRELLQDVPKSDLLDLLPLSPVQFDKLTGLDDFDWETLATGDISADQKSWVERTYRLPKDAAEVIDEAISAAKEDEPELLDWQALEMLAADYLSGARTSATPSRPQMAPASTAAR